ncbi:MAG: hypothetical protein SH818_11465 [Saprospiraceae bacterium]|nr:hypothetical protein [Saprospiraceae bacterium]
MAWNWLSDRNPGYQKIAEKLGMLYQEKDLNKEILSAHKVFKLFSMGGSKKVRYILSGNLESKEPAFIFEYSYVVSTGKSSHTYFQHVLSVRLARNLPPFTLRPENFFHKIGEWLGFKDIDFEAYPQFSDAYRLKSNNENKVRNLFNEFLLGFLSYEKGWWIECNGNNIIYFKFAKRMNQEMVEPFIEVASTLHLLLTGFKKLDNNHI